MSARHHGRRTTIAPRVVAVVALAAALAGCGPAATQPAADQARSSGPSGQAPTEQAADPAQQLQDEVRTAAHPLQIAPPDDASCPDDVSVAGATGVQVTLQPSQLDLPTPYCTYGTGAEDESISLIYNSSPIATTYTQASTATSSTNGGWFVDLPDVAPSAYAVVFTDDAVLRLNTLAVPDSAGTGQWAVLALNVPGDVARQLWGLADLAASYY